MTRNLKTLFALTFCSLTYRGAIQAQPAPPTTILEIDVENSVQYFEDTSDLTKLATVPGPTTPAPAKNFGKAFELDDVVAVNGQPARGTLILSWRTLAL